MIRWEIRGVWFATVAALLGAVADCLLLYNPAGSYEVPGFEFLRAISPVRLQAGYFLGLAFIPLQVLGLPLLYRMVKSAGAVAARLLVVPAVLLPLPGVYVHGAFAYIGFVVHQQPNMPPDEYQSLLAQHQSLLDPMTQVVFVLFTIVSFGLAYLVIRGQTRLAIYFAWANPLFLWILLILPYVLGLPGGALLAPAAFNLSMAVFFLLIAVYATRFYRSLA